MTILDTYAVIAFLNGESAASEVRALLAAGDARQTAIGVAETVDHRVRLSGRSERQAVVDLGLLGLLEAVPVDFAIGADAGRLRARHYHRTRCAVSMADCVAAAVAQSAHEPLATSDPDLLDMCFREGIAVVPLPGSDGSRWTPPAH
ncbi:MAG: PIN domain-containing protein [Actinomycetia bacterium]|nr:PIN domain-containing protein [Actinomycetes bacterium]